MLKLPCDLPRAPAPGHKNWFYVENRVFLTAQLVDRESASSSVKIILKAHLGDIAFCTRSGSF